MLISVPGARFPGGRAVSLQESRALHSNQLAKTNQVHRGITLYKEPNKKIQKQLLMEKAQLKTGRLYDENDEKFS